ncbi:hypothetical protein [Polyangium aurulentum]|uniref:hypothetical protein n=1 Tax=Polyangium aurulentum TaxID=2567896 RepID=UPI0010AEE3EA|nr:hypothetical protein [Polyangium aurulentum]UQA55967.1 hypothetical protein E8A73_032210 [Polyangium aurulentum]
MAAIFGKASAWASLAMVLVACGSTNDPPGDGPGSGGAGGAGGSGGGPVDAPLPEWVPQPGQIVNVNLNNLSDVSPCPEKGCWYFAGGQQAPWRNWNGAAFASGFSTYGAMVFWGGGHGGGDDVSLYVFDFTSNKWSRVGPSNPETDYNGLVDPTWQDYLHEGSYIVPALHTYNYPTYVPPNKSGTGPKGSWLLPMLVRNGPPVAPHAVDLETGVWTRFSSAIGTFEAQGPYTGVLEDTKRGRIFWAGSDEPGVNWLDFEETHPRTIHREKIAWAWATGGYYPRHVYVPEVDMAVGFWTQYGQTKVLGEVLDMSSGVPVLKAFIPWPDHDVNGAGFGVDWCPITKKFYIYEGRGKNTVETLTPSSLDFTTATWTWGTETFGGDAPAWSTEMTGGGGDVAMSKWRYIPQLRSFAWSDGVAYSAPVDGVTRDGIMQLWRPSGT